MIFSSLYFLFIFFPVFLLCYYLVPKKAKNAVLCFFSLVFYAWGEPIYILLMIFSSSFNFVNGLILEKTTSLKKRKFILVETVVINLGLLGFFKYMDFFIETTNNLFKLDINTLGIALPIGISFFTFQTMTYTIDVYHKDVETEHNFLDFLTYVCMFPQLIAGPIVRYETVAKELHNRTISYDKICMGLSRFLQGLFKKVLIANNMGLLWNTVSNSDYSEISVATAWLASVAFTFQIYFDFSGYSDMAIGMGKMLGFNYPENFNYPFTSKSITEFWRRWHMTLSTFFRDYVYIPLGGNRKGKLRQVFNLLLVWGLTGMWHGAALNFILWGLYYGIILLLEKFIWGKYLEKLPAILRHVYSIFIIVVGFTIFVFDDFNKFFPYASILFFTSGNALINTALFDILLNHLVIIIVAIIISAPTYKYIANKLSNIKSKGFQMFYAISSTVMYVVLFMITISYLVNDSYNPFLYFRF